MKLLVYSKDINLIDRYNSLFLDYKYKSVSEYSDLCYEAKKESIVVLMSITDCTDDIETFLNPLVELHTYIIILDEVPKYEICKKLITLGVRAYGNIMMDDIHLKEAINNVMDGNIWLYPEFINETVTKMRFESNPNLIHEQFKILTLREKEVANLVLEKMSYTEISEKLNITLRTVKAHTKNIYDKFHVQNRLSFILLFNK
ncbi:response regulator transcription factor [Poseidonibacter sp.]|uniref:response regulator transcription factor n=1 Tax=Poseidonibacter sp. TaxID=2321188 RepID=UPI003C71B6C9